MKSLIVYFSRKGNNYVNGDIINLEVGNTYKATKIIKDMTSSDSFEIKPLIDYPEDYDLCVKKVEEELINNSRPELSDYLDDISMYDVIYLGYPCWCGTLPSIVCTFLEKYDFDGKIIKPFCTNEGSGMGRSEIDIKKICPKARIRSGLSIVGHDVNNCTDKIRRWIDE